MTLRNYFTLRVSFDRHQIYKQEPYKTIHFFCITLSVTFTAPLTLTPHILDNKLHMSVEFSS
jgi:hypothetical protein